MHGDRELLAAEPPGPHDTGVVVWRQRVGHHPQHLVSDIVAVRVVDRLEAIEIDKAEKVRALPVELVEIAAVGQPGQRIGHRRFERRKRHGALAIAILAQGLRLVCNRHRHDERLECQSEEEQVVEPHGGEIEIGAAQHALDPQHDQCRPCEREADDRSLAPPQGGADDPEQDDDEGDEGEMEYGARVEVEPRTQRQGQRGDEASERANGEADLLRARERAFVDMQVEDRGDHHHPYPEQGIAERLAIP